MFGTIDCVLTLCSLAWIICISEEYCHQNSTKSSKHFHRTRTRVICNILHVPHPFCVCLLNILAHLNVLSATNMSVVLSTPFNIFCFNPFNGIPQNFPQSQHRKYEQSLASVHAWCYHYFGMWALFVCWRCWNSSCVSWSAALPFNYVLFLPLFLSVTVPP